jgi:hypothetical protein
MIDPLRVLSHTRTSFVQCACAAVSVSNMRTDVAATTIAGIGGIDAIAGPQASDGARKADAPKLHGDLKRTFATSNGLREFDAHVKGFRYRAVPCSGQPGEAYERCPADRSKKSCCPTQHVQP